jgi:large subunit ribosomal protein L32e
MATTKEKKGGKAAGKKGVKKKAGKAEKKPVKKPAKPKPGKPVKKPAKPKPGKPVKKPAKPKAKKGRKKVKKEEKPEVKEEPEVEVKPAEKPVPKPKQPKPIAKIKYSGRGGLPASGKRKPRFRRQEYGKLARLEDKWRSCRGIDSKKAEGKRGKGKTPKIGYGKPKDRAGIVRGFRPVFVETLKDLESVDSKTHAIVISARVGRRKRNQIIEEANKHKINVLNPRKGEVEVR